VTGASNTATRLSSLEDSITGKTLDESTVADAVAGAISGLTINGDDFAPENYRSHLVEVLTRRALLNTQV
jgi:carbon-monoxide dehydrogenase medium subunit